MYSKIANLLSIKSWSLVNKLMILYVFTTMLIVAVVCLILFPTFERVTHFADPYHVHILFEACIEKLVLALLLSILSSIVFGKIVAHHGIRRIHLFARSIEKITAHSLQDKMNLADWPNELKPLINTFNAMLDRIHVGCDQLNQFSSDIAHELRNPINHLVGITEITLSKERSTVEYRCLLESQLEEYHHLSRLIENLLFIARSDHGKTPFNQTKLQAHQEIGKVMEYYQIIAEENSIAMYCDCEALIFADSTLFRRMMSNLLANALKYTPHGGKINIK